MSGDAALIALAAALLFALGTVLQQRVAAATPSGEAARAGFLLRLARRPLWLSGIAADGAGFVLHAAALAIGGLVVVQPVLATTVVFCLPLAAALEHRRIRARELAAAAAVTAGLACFLVVAMPSGGRVDATAAGWAASFAIAGLVSGALVAAARGRAAPRRPCSSARRPACCSGSAPGSSRRPWSSSTTASSPCSPTGTSTPWRRSATSRRRSARWRSRPARSEPPSRRRPRSTPWRACCSGSSRSRSASTRTPPGSRARSRASPS